MSREKNKSIQIRTFKAKIRGSKPHFMQKVVFSRITVKDAFNKRFRSFISVFYPKLTPKYPTAHIMLHCSNGAGSFLMRVEDPEVLIKTLQRIIETLQSDKWRENWWRVKDISENLIQNNKLIMNEELVDINEWHKELENTLDVELVETKIENTEDTED